MPSALRFLFLAALGSGQAPESPQGACGLSSIESEEGLDRMHLLQTDLRHGDLSRWLVHRRRRGLFSDELFGKCVGVRTTERNFGGKKTLYGIDGFSGCLYSPNLKSLLAKMMPIGCRLDLYDNTDIICDSKPLPVLQPEKSQTSIVTDIPKFFGNNIWEIGCYCEGVYMTQQPLAGGNVSLMAPARASGVDVGGKGILSRFTGHEALGDGADEELEVAGRRRRGWRHTGDSACSWVFFRNVNFGPTHSRYHFNAERGECRDYAGAERRASSAFAVVDAGCRLVFYDRKGCAGSRNWVRFAPLSGAFRSEATVRIHSHFNRLFSFGKHWNDRVLSSKCECQ